MSIDPEAQELDVHLDSPDFGGDVVVGRLRRAGDRAGSLVSFGFDPGWLSRGQSLILDPELGQFEGDQYPRDNRLFGILSDIAPDRWGRTLLQRRESARARREGRRVRALDAWDYLIQVSDVSRMGALRLRTPNSQRFLSDDPQPIPPIARLRQLQHFARRTETGEPLSPSDEEEEIAMLVAPGSSLGGARPKATFQDADGTLWIAKFPSSSDTWDAAAWELVLHRLAANSGVTVPATRLVTLAGKQRTFVAQRFDRTGAVRHLYASAMTLTSRRDHDPDGSYLEIAQAITQFGDPATINQDLEQLFRRVLFNVTTGNRDDHLRNHGFLGEPRGWRLSPGFDLNPAPNTRQHAIALDATDHTPDLALVMATARTYRVTPVRAHAILDEVRSAVGQWRSVAKENDIRADEIDLMANAFVD
jgi:serine/threonine-protein kinase HipA